MVWQAFGNCIKLIPGSRLFAVSGLTEKDKLAKVDEAHVYAFLTKPYTAEKIIECHARYSKSVTETPPSAAHPQGSGGCNPQRRKTKVKKALIIRLSVADIFNYIKKLFTHHLRFYNI